MPVSHCQSARCEWNGGGMESSMAWNRVSRKGSFLEQDLIWSLSAVSIMLTKRDGRRRVTPSLS